jgi:hypothetical protein
MEQRVRTLITWSQDYPGGRWIARLGTIMVGAVIVADTYAQWIEWLPYEHGSHLADWKYVKREDQAKHAVEQHVLQWLTSAGILDLAERDRADAKFLPLFSEAKSQP